MTPPSTEIVNPAPPPKPFRGRVASDPDQVDGADVVAGAFSLQKSAKNSFSGRQVGRSPFFTRIQAKYFDETRLNSAGAYMNDQP
jgi:hypothetical protein